MLIALASAFAASPLRRDRPDTAGQAPPAAARPADLVIRGGTIVTVDDARPEAAAMAVNGDTIVALGSDQEIQRYVGPATRVIDLKGALATPGFIDAHVHFTGVGEAARNLKLATARNWDDIVRMVGEAARKARPGDWILGRGWHQEKWSEVPSPNVDGFPLHEALSRVSPNNPVWLTHASGHAGFANALAMKMAEVQRTTPDPAGGQILKDKDGNPTGLFNERAQSLISGALARDRATRTPAQVEADLREVIALASQEVLSKGLTSVHDAGSPPSTIEVMKKVVDERQLPLRVWMMLREDAGPARGGHAEIPRRQLRRQAIHRARDQAGDRRRPRIARRVDARAVRRPGDDERDAHRLAGRHQDDRGARDQERLPDGGARHRRPRQPRDAEYLRGARSSRHPEKSGKALRWRMEHAQHISAADIPRFGRLGVIASMEGIHCTSDAPYVLARLGPKRAEEGAYVWQKLMKSGAIIANGTDAPVEDIDPIPSFYASVSRRVKDGSVFFPDQRMSRMEALRSYTINAAFAGFDEGDQGIARRRQAGRRHRLLEEHHDDSRGSDSDRANSLHDRRRESAILRARRDLISTLTANDERKDCAAPWRPLRSCVEDNMESVIAGLLKDFEDGKMTRRQLIQSLALAAVAAAPGASALAQTAAAAAEAADSAGVRTDRMEDGVAGPHFVPGVGLPPQRGVLPRSHGLDDPERQRHVPGVDEHQRARRHHHS